MVEPVDERRRVSALRCRMRGMSSVVEALTALGGVATRGVLIGRTSRADFDGALAAGHLIRVGRGRYALAAVDEAVAVAHRLAGVLCLTSAALHWGWAVKSVPERPQVSVGRNRKITAHHRRGVDLHQLRLGADDVVDGVTSRDRTILDCLRLLPADEALAVVDSALRDGMTKTHLLALARDLRGPGSVRARQVAELGDHRAANPFESVLRAICLRVAGLEAVPQVNIRRTVGPGQTKWVGRPDLVDRRLRIVIEAESFAWHGDKDALTRDARRFNELAIDGWLVLRFSWVEVMFQPDRVAAVVEAAVAERANQLCMACRCAS